MTESSETFTVTEQHLKLLDRANIRWCDAEAGAPEINPKRPYGNSSYKYDVAEICGLGVDDDEDRIRTLHHDMEKVVQILVQNQSIEAQTYVNVSEYGSDWEPIDAVDSVDVDESIDVEEELRRIERDLDDLISELDGNLSTWVESLADSVYKLRRHGLKNRQT
jgi:hypothetical protein